MEVLSSALDQFDDVLFALLIGSRANATARPDSDWDVCVWIRRDFPALARLSLLEEVRVALAGALNLSPSAVDVVDLAFSSLAMRAEAADHGQLLKQDAGSFYNRFLNRTWRELEDFAWEQRRAA